MDNVNGIEITSTIYRCYRWDPRRGRGNEYIGECLRTTNVGELKEHRVMVVLAPSTARIHGLDIYRYDAEGNVVNNTGMCLFDAVIDVEEGTVLHFLDAQRVRRERE